MSEMMVIDGDGQAPSALPMASTPTEMLAQALQSGAAPETMEKLMALQERWQAGQARKAFDLAMAQLRANVPTVIKSTEGHGYKYEQLADITEAVSSLMADLGLSFRWRTESNEKAVKVTCIIAHKDGHYEETSLVHLPDKSGSKNDIQALGSAVTYLQRYTLKAAVGVAAAKDDDGQRAQAQQAPPERISSAQLKRDGAFDAFEANLKKLTNEDDARAWFSSEKTQARLSQWPHKWQDAAEDALEAHIKSLSKPDETAPTDDDTRPADDIIDEFETVISGIEEASEIYAAFEEYVGKPAIVAFPGDKIRLEAVRDARIEGLS
jgi:tellurite resistance protein